MVRQFISVFVTCENYILQTFVSEQRVEKHHLPCNSETLFVELIVRYCCVSVHIKSKTPKFITFNDKISHEISCAKNEITPLTLRSCADDSCSGAINQLTQYDFQKIHQCECAT